ncbi:MAG: tetratricopeptide repeat protein [Flavobacteriales bacterium]
MIKSLQNILNYTLLGAILVLFVYSCSTEKDAFLNRTYHDMNAKYNGYFNAREIIKEALVNFENSHIDDFDRVLPLFIYPTQETAQSLNSPMDTARKKCEIVISRHSMPENKTGSFKKTEWCKWIDNNWMVVGETRFYKREFSEALAVFKYVSSEYDKDPIKHESELWRAKIYLEINNFEEARRILDDLELRLESQAEKSKAKDSKSTTKTKSKKPPKGVAKKKTPFKQTSKKKQKAKEEKQKEPEVPPKLKRDVELVYADLYLREKNYQKALEKLEEAVKFKHKRKKRARIYFIMAQLYQRQGRVENANQMYAEVIKLNPRYDMTFQATIFQALNAGGDSKAIKSRLLKMLRDDKNKEFQDQIYYALAEIELRQNNRPKGIAYLEKSVTTSINNRNQKTKSLVRISELYYLEKDYFAAERYYDSTVAIIPESYPKYSEIVAKSKSLTELIDNLKLVARQDSLLALANMSEKDRIRKIEKIITNLKEEEARKKAELEQQELDLRNAPLQNAIQAPAAPGGGFWAYNNTARGIGYNDFKKVYGSRKLEDDWRRSNKGQVFQEFGDGSENVPEEEKEIYKVEHYLKDLPLTAEQQEEAHLSIQKALYDAGFIYKNRLKDEDAAIKTYKEFYKRYTQARLTPAALYQLYLLVGANEKDGYKNTVIKDFPESEYAKILLDPNYKKEESKSRVVWEREYKEVYSFYTKGDYATTVARCNEKIAEPKFEYTCKYLFLKASALAKSSNPETNPEVEDALKEVVKNCSEDPIGEIAQKSLEFLKKQATVSEVKSGQGKYIYNTTESHMFILVFPNSAGSVNKAKTKVSDLNTSSYGDYGLKVSSNFIDAENQIIVVKSFPNKDKAMNYYFGFKQNKNNVADYNKDFTYFVISEQNYAALYVDKNIQEYLGFFNKNYKE